MANLIPVAALLLGLVLGAVCTWLILKSRIRQAVAEAGAAAVAEKTGLLERLQARDQSLSEMKAELHEKELAIGTYP